MSESKTGSQFDPKELTPIAFGLCIGAGILTFFILLGLTIGLTPSLQFGVPPQ